MPPDVPRIRSAPGTSVTLTVVPSAIARRAVAAVALLAPLLAGCATPPKNPEARAAFEQTNDPLEPINRKILDANMVFDKLLFRPVAKIYVAILPEGGRDAVHRLLANLKEPVIVVNNVLEGRFKGAGVSVGRFAINSTAGLVGLFDVAKKWGLNEQPADFGQTLYVWGFPQGPYLVLPILGPSNPRDAIGMGVDAYMDPFDYLATKADLDEFQIGRFVLDGIDRRARVLDVLDDLEKNSLDFYAQLRSLSQQQRAAELHGGKTAPAPESPSFYNDPGKAAPPARPAPATTSAPAPEPASFYADPGKPAPAAAPKSAAPLPRARKPAAPAITPPPLTPAAATVAPTPARPLAADPEPDEGPLRLSPGS